MTYLSSFRLPAVVLALCFLAAPAASAGVLLSLESVTAAPGSSGNQFDVLLTNTGPAPVTVAGFSFSLFVTNAQIVFVDGTTATAAPYIFAGNSLFGPAIANLPNSQTVEATDLYDVPFSGATVGANATVGLGRVTFDLTNGATPGVFSVAFNGFPSTSLSDPDAADIPIDQLVSGSITISGGTAAPEPSSAALLVFAATAMLVRRRLP